MNLIKNFLRFTLFLFITIVLIEITSAILLKIDFFEKRNHTFLTKEYTEIINDNELNLKKNFFTNKNKDWEVFTDKNRLRVEEENFNHDLFSNNEKIVFIGDSVPFGFGVNYKDSIPGSFSEYNLNLISINAAVPSYTFKQSVDKYIKEFKSIKKIKYIYLSNFNPLDLYLMFGAKWNEDINWSNHVSYLSEDLFFFKYKKIPLWGDINFFSILRKIYIVYFFKSKNYFDNSRNYETDLKFSNYINNQLNRLYKNIDLNTKLILSPTISPLYFVEEDDLNKVDKERLKVLNLINYEIKNFKKKNVIYLDLHKVFHSFESKDLFIDNCCHLTPFASSKIAEKLSSIVN